MPGGQCSSAHIHKLEHSLSCFLDNSTSALKQVVLLLCSSRCCDPAAGEELEICIVLVLWEIPNTGDTHSFPMLPVFLSYG